MHKKDDDYFGLVSKNNILELAMQEFNMFLLHKLFETRDYLLKHYNLSHLDGIDQAEVALVVYKMREKYELDSEFSELTIHEIFADAMFQKEVDTFIARFQSFDDIL